MHWYPCIPVSGVSNAEHDSQCIPLLLFQTSGMWNPYVRIYGTAIRLSLNIFLNQFVKCRSVTGQALLFFIASGAF